MDFDFGSLTNSLPSIGTGGFNPNNDKVVTPIKYPTIPQADREPVTLINPQNDKGPWIAGGAPMRWYQGQPVGDSDIDVFCRSARQAETLIDEIKSYGRYHVKADTANAVTIDYWTKGDVTTKWTIQIIKRTFFNSIEEIIKTFDITVCQIATDGESWTLGERTARDIREKNLCMSLPLHDDAVKRLVKHWVYGFRPVDGLLDAIKDNPETKWAFNPAEDYSDAF